MPVSGFGWWHVCQRAAGAGAALFRIGTMGARAAVTVGVGWADPGAPAIWRSLCATADLPLGAGIAADREPGRPWCGDRIESAAAAVPGVEAAMLWEAGVSLVRLGGRGSQRCVTSSIIRQHQRIRVSTD